jgi:hypothetical protein
MKFILCLWKNVDLDLKQIPLVCYSAQHTHTPTNWKARKAICFTAACFQWNIFLSEIVYVWRRRGEGQSFPIPTLNFT